MPSSANKGYTQPTYNSEVGSWGSDVNTNLTGIVDLNLGGQVSVALSSTNVTLTSGAAGQMQNLIVTLTGTLLANVTVSSAAIGFYLVENRTTGAFSVTWAANFGAGAVGTSWVIPQGYSVLFFSDTTYGARCLNWMPLLLAATSDATPAILRRTENDATARKALSIQSGLGSGNDYAIYETGDASSNVATVTEQIGSTVIGTKTAAAYGFPIPLDLTEIATPSAPASGALRLYSKSGDILAIQGSGGAERIVGLTTPSAQSLTIKNDGTTPNTKIGVTATQAILTNSGGAPILATSISIIINLGINGANGLDAGSLAPSTWYHVYLISNGTATAGLASTSATSPTLPAGYTYSMRIGTVRTDGSSNLYRTIQLGRDAVWSLVAATNTTVYPTLASGSTGGAWSAIAVGSFIPSTATRIRGAIVFAANSSGRYAVVAPNNVVAAGGAAAGAGAIGAGQQGTYGQPLTGQFDFVLESSSIYFSSADAGEMALLHGWTDAVNAC